MRVRSKARAHALQLLYQIEISKQPHQEAIDQHLRKDPPKEEITEFLKQLVTGVCENKQFLDSLLIKHVKNWEIDRMAVVDKNIIRLAAFELLYLDDIPPKVSINEGVELAKKFGDIDSPRFVNGILDKIYKEESKKYGGSGAS